MKTLVVGEKNCNEFAGFLTYYLLKAIEKSSVLDNSVLVCTPEEMSLQSDKAVEASVFVRDFSEVERFKVYLRQVNKNFLWTYSWDKYKQYKETTNFPSEIFSNVCFCVREGGWWPISRYIYWGIPTLQAVFAGKGFKDCTVDEKFINRIEKSICGNINKKIVSYKKFVFDLSACVKEKEEDSTETKVLVQPQLKKQSEDKKQISVKKKNWIIIPKRKKTKLNVLIADSDLSLILSMLSVLKDFCKVETKTQLKCFVYSKLVSKLDYDRVLPVINNLKKQGLKVEFTGEINSNIDLLLSLKRSLCVDFLGKDKYVISSGVLGQELINEFPTTVGIFYQHTKTKDIFEIVKQFLAL